MNEQLTEFQKQYLEAQEAQRKNEVNLGVFKKRLEDKAITLSAKMQALIDACNAAPEPLRSTFLPIIGEPLDVTQLESNAYIRDLGDRLQKVGEAILQLRQVNE